MTGPPRADARPLPPVPHVKVRRATVSDIDALVDLRVALFTEIGRLSRDPGEGAWFREATREYLAAKLPGGDFLAWVGELDGKVIATSGLVFFDVPPQPQNPAGLEAYLMNMFTLPEYRGRGIAEAVLAAIVGYVKTTPCRRIQLYTTPDGRRLYEKAGFVSSHRGMELTW